MTTDETAHPDVEVTAPVIERKPEPWEMHRLTKEQWDALEIPEFLRRKDTPSGSTTTATPAATVPAADAYAGETSGRPSEPSELSAPPSVSEFDKFRVDPAEIEQKIRLEADRRWRNWISSKGELKRPRLATYVKRVRKEFYS